MHMLGTERLKGHTGRAGHCRRAGLSCPVAADGQQRRQPGRAGGQQQRLIQWRAAPLEDVQPQRVTARLRGGQQPQHGRRRLVPGLRRAHHKQQLGVLGCGHLQAPQLVRARLGQPGQHGGYIFAAQGLLGGPQPAGGRGGVDAQQPVRIKPLACQPRRKRRMRCAHQHHGSA